MLNGIDASDCRQLDSKEPVVYFYVYFSGIMSVSDMEAFFIMMGQKDNSERNRIEFISLEDLVPKNHLVRKNRCCSFLCQSLL